MSGLDADAARIAADGSATFTWLARDGHVLEIADPGADALRHRQAKLDHHLSTPAENPANPELSLAANGNAIVTWTHNASGIRAARAAVGPQSLVESRFFWTRLPE